MDQPSMIPFRNPLWNYLVELEGFGSWPGEMTLRALIARLLFLKSGGTVPRLHPQMTLHDLRHGETVASHASQIALKAGLLSADNDQALRAEEAYLLLAASFLHDIGMGMTNGLADQTEARSLGVTPNDVVRRNHHERSEKFVNEHTQELYVDRRQARTLGLLCKSHRSCEILGQPPYENQPGPMGEITRLPLLGAILRIADEIDLDYSRAPEKVRDLWDSTGWFDPISRLHWLKHFYTLGVSVEGVTAGPDLVIRPRITIRVPRGTNGDYHYEKTKELIRRHLQAEIESVSAVAMPGFRFGHPEFKREDDAYIPSRFLRRSRINVLLVEDDQSYGEAAKAGLEAHFGEVRYVTTALEALAAITVDPGQFHATLIDLHIPGETGILDVEAGLVLISAVSQVASNLAIVANTGHRDAGLEERALRAGAHIFRTKSTGGETDDIIASVEQALGKLGYQID